DNSNVTFTGTIEGAQALTVNTSGVTTFGGAVGDVTPLAALTTNPGVAPALFAQLAGQGIAAAATTQINGGTVATAGPQTYNNAVILGANLTLNSGGGNIAFNSTFSGGAGPVSTGYNLTLDDGIGAGTTTFVGAVTNLGTGNAQALVVNNGVTGLIWFQSTLNANSGIYTDKDSPNQTSFQFDGNVTLKEGTDETGTYLNGNVTFNNMTFATSGPLSFGNVSLIGGPVTITSGANPLTFNGPVNGAQNLVIGTTGVTTFNGPVGPSGPLASLSTGRWGTTVINGGSVMTTGAQVYNNNVTLGANALLLSTGNAAIVFNGSVDGAYNLAANTGGATVFNGAVGAVTPLASLSTWFGGTTTIAGSEICTTGAQNYQGDVATLASKTALMSTANRPISFACVINPGGSGYGSLSVITGCTTTSSGCTLQGNMGAGRSTSVLMTSAKGVMNLDGARLKINDMGGSAGSTYTIVSGPPRGVTGTFMGLPEGAILNAANNGTPYRIHYTRNSVTLKQLVNTQTVLSVPPAPIHAGQRLAFSAAVSTVQGAVPTGTVTFLIDGRVVRT